MMDLCRLIIMDLYALRDHPVAVNDAEEGAGLNLELFCVKRRNGRNNKHWDVALNRGIERKP